MVLSSGSFSNLCNRRNCSVYINILSLPSSSSLWICARNFNLFFRNAIFMALGFCISATKWFSHCLIATFCQLPPCFMFSGTVGRIFWSTLSYLHPNPFVDEPQGKKLAALSISLIKLFLFKIKFVCVCFNKVTNKPCQRMNKQILLKPQTNYEYPFLQHAREEGSTGGGEGRALHGSRGGVGDKGPRWVPFTHLGYDCVGPGCMFVVVTSK